MPLARINGGQPTVGVPLIVQPSDAKVLVDGVFVGRANEFTAAKGGLPLTAGGHVIRLESEEFLSETIEIVPQPNPKPIEVKMLPRPKEKK
jgi:hypothetical protein